MAEQSDSVDKLVLTRLATIEFVIHAVAVDFLSVEGSEIRISRFRPYIIGAVAGLTLRVSGIDDVNEVDITVAVTVVLAEVDTVVDSRASIRDETGHIVIAGTIIAQRMRQFHGTHNIELRGKLAETHILEVALHTLGVAVLAVSTVDNVACFIIEIVIETGLRVGKSERCVGKFDKDNECLWRAHVREESTVVAYFHLPCHTVSPFCHRQFTGLT